MIIKPLTSFNIFEKNRIFEISVSCTTLAWDGIICWFRNGWPSYFQRMKFKHIETEWAAKIPEINPFQLWKSGPKVARKSMDCTSAFVRAMAPADAIHLRCNHSTKHLKDEPRRREAMKFAPAKKIRDFWCPNPFTSFNIFENFKFSEFRCRALP